MCSCTPPTDDPVISFAPVLFAMSMIAVNVYAPAGSSTIVESESVPEGPDGPTVGASTWKVPAGPVRRPNVEISNNAGSEFGLGNEQRLDIARFTVVGAVTEKVSVYVMFNEARP